MDVVIKRSAAAKKQGKKLPKRTGRRKDYNARLWAAQQKRKEARRKAQEARHAANVAAGITPWQIAKAKRYAKRHSAS